MYDSRLFNQTGGLDQGFGAEDSYTVYDKAMGKGEGFTVGCSFFALVVGVVWGVRRARAMRSMRVCLLPRERES